jgi:hypothetical protein
MGGVQISISRNLSDGIAGKFEVLQKVTNGKGSVDLGGTFAADSIIYSIVTAIPIPGEDLEVERVEYELMARFDRESEDIKLSPGDKGSIMSDIKDGKVEIKW